MSREINEAHATEVTPQQRDREGERGCRGSVADLCFPVRGKTVHEKHRTGRSHCNEASLAVHFITRVSG